MGKNRDLVVFALFAAALCGLAILRGPDASWDLRNYHIYNAYAVLNHRFGYDLFPAQLQTFHAPILDVLYESARIAFNAHPKALSALLALPHAVAAFLAYRITLLFVPSSLPARELLAFVTVVIGASGAAGLPTLASPASEMVPGCYALAALLIVLKDLGSRHGWRKTISAGLLLGIAAGFKLTAVPYCIGVIAAWTLCSPRTFPERVTGTLIFVGAFLLGAALIAGPWWLGLYREYGNPLFPYFNALFRSSLLHPVNISDGRFRPSGVLQALLYPFFWALNPKTYVAELPIRDARFALAYTTVAACALQQIIGWRCARFASELGSRSPDSLNRALKTEPPELDNFDLKSSCAEARWLEAESPESLHRALNTATLELDDFDLKSSCSRTANRTAPFFICFFALSFCLWEAEFSIFRYLAPLELLCGLPILLALIPLRARLPLIPSNMSSDLLRDAQRSPSIRGFLSIAPNWMAETLPGPNPGAARTDRSIRLPFGITWNRSGCLLASRFARWWMCVASTAAGSGLRRTRYGLHTTLAALCCGLSAWTIAPDWGHAAASKLAADVHFPEIAADSLVILLDPAPMAYVAAFAPPQIRFVGVNNNLVHPGRGEPLESIARIAIATHPGPLWGLLSTELAPGVSEATLEYYGLHREGKCQPVSSNLDNNAILACPLRRAHPDQSRRSTLIPLA